MAYQFHGISILVVEDNPPMLDLAKSIFLTFGVGQVITAREGGEGFEKFCKFNPDIVLADWMMEPMDGIALTQKIRMDPMSPNRYVPVILMTGFSEKHRVMQARDAGVTEFLVKPFNARDMYRRIVQVIEKPRRFVHTGEYFGPERRRIREEDYSGEMKRTDD